MAKRQTPQPALETETTAQAEAPTPPAPPTSGEIRRLAGEVGTARAEYERLLAKTSGHHAETKKLLAAHDEARKELAKRRAREIAELLDKKGAAYGRLEQATTELDAAEKADAEATAVV
jgi:hypothetical protein